MRSGWEQPVVTVAVEWSGWAATWAAQSEPAYRRAAASGSAHQPRAARLPSLPAAEAVEQPRLAVGSAEAAPSLARALVSVLPAAA
jgi:hypothetical protein